MSERVDDVHACMVKAHLRIQLDRCLRKDAL